LGEVVFLRILGVGIGFLSDCGSLIETFFTSHSLVVNSY